jgi:integrase
MYSPTAALIDVRAYDRRVELSADEAMGLRRLLSPPPRGRPLERFLARVEGCDRLAQPLADALSATSGDQWWKWRAMHALLRACAIEGTAYWGWDTVTWRRYLSPVTKWTPVGERPKVTPVFRWAAAARQHMVGAAYRLGVSPDPLELPAVRWFGVAEKVFGPDETGRCISEVEAVIESWGYSRGRRRDLRSLTAEALIRCGHADLGRIADIDLAAWRQAEPQTRRGLIYLLSRALAKLGVLTDAIEMEPPGRAAAVKEAAERHVPSEWRHWVERWENTSTLSYATRRGARNYLLKIGRWLASVHPSMTGPEKWDCALAATAVFAVTRMRIGDFTAQGPYDRPERVGQPLSPRAQVAIIQSLRIFFRDAQEWEWIPRRFTPYRAFAIPRSVKALIGPQPRPIANDHWAKLVWAGLNVVPDDLPRFGREAAGRPRSPMTFYPEPMLRALALVWLFTGLRSDEIVRLRVGCIRWQEEDIAVPGRPGDVLARDAVCMLEVPVNKTGAAFTKPVDPLVGRAITTWEAARAAQPPFRDRKTGELVDLLFCHRARRIQKTYINATLIPALCGKAGVPVEDQHGRLTSHRARATIASQLYIAKDPMTLFELQAWLGHSSPHSTQHYAKLTPLTLAKAYTDAGYFARNIRAIEVLIDRDAVQSGATTSGSPWEYFDVGHGYCTYSFFEQCPHRMACPRCDFYVPKGSLRRRSSRRRRRAHAR